MSEPRLEPYSALVMDHFYNPRNAYRMDDASVVGHAGKPGGGPFLTLFLKLERDQVTAASFQTFGCAPAIAAGSLLAERLPGSTLPEAVERWTEEAIHEALGGLPDHKRHCSALAAEALASALVSAAHDLRSTNG